MDQLNENKDLRARIFAAADKLYAELGRETFPTVDAVRRESRAAMGDVSALMREWRKSQTAQATTPVIQVPDAILRAAQALAADTWEQAQELATESLRTAQQAWDAERAEADALRAELGTAYDAQAAELETTLSELSTTQAALELANGEIDGLHTDIGDAQATIKRLESQVQTLTEKSDALKTQLASIEKALKTETAARTEAEKTVAVTHTKLDAMQDRLADLQATITTEREQAAGAAKQGTAQASDYQARIATLESQIAQDRAALDTAQQATTEARERAARLEGELDALRDQLQKQKKAPAKSTPAKRKTNPTSAIA